MLKRVDTSGSVGSHAQAFAIMKRELDDDTSVISVEGELDLSTAPRLKWMLIDALEAGATRLVLDLALATFMDSTALGVLVAVNRKLEPGVRFAIVCTRENLLQVFEFSGTDGTFAIHPTLEDALSDVRGDRASA